MSDTSSCALMAAILLPACAGYAVGAELCVVCSEPAMTYRCALEGDTQPGSARPGLQLLCIKELATRGGHRSCSIERAQPAANCNGALVTIAQPAGNLAPAATLPPPAPSTTQNPPAPIPAAEPTPKEAPPPTVEALAKQTAEQSKKDWENSNTELKESAANAGHKLEQAGSAVGKAVKKSWDCLTSLFSKC
jgi:hypothetical protein